MIRATNRFLLLAQAVFAGFDLTATIAWSAFDELAPAAVDHLLLLAWNFERELVQRSRSAGYAGRYIRPAPEVAVFG